MSEIDLVLKSLEPYFARGQWKEAGAFIDETLGGLEELAAVLRIRGLAAREEGDLASARRALAAATALVAQDATAHASLAEVCWKLEDYRAAASAARAALRVDPGAARARRVFDAVTRKLGVVPDTLYAFYDLATSPVTFDFVSFLQLAEVERRRQGLGGLRVIFVPGTQDGFRRMTERDRAYERMRKEWRVRNIQVPACRLVPACAEPIVCTSRLEALGYVQAAGGHVFPLEYSVLAPNADYRLGRLLEAAAAGHEVRVLEPTGQALAHVREWLERQCRGRAAVSLTLRQSDYQAWRNSDLASWARFARWLEDKGYQPVIVPDTESYLSGRSAALGAGVEYPAAAVNIELRCALYNSCLLNMMVGNGPLGLCTAGASVRYVVVVLLQDGATAANAEWFAEQGLTVGTQPRFAGAFQRFAWSGQAFETLVAEFESMAERLREPGSAVQ